jgi:hypothetical protein
VGQRPRRADAHGSRRAQFRFRLPHQVRHRFERGPVIGLRRGNAAAQQFAALIIQRHDFDLAAAEVDAEA